MQLHLLTATLILASNLLFFTPISAFHEELVKRNLKRREGYHCGTRVFSQDLLEQIAAQAAGLLTTDSSSEFDNGKPAFPAPYTGPIIYKTNEKLWLWPLSDPAQQQPWDFDVYYLILGGNPRKVIGVIRQNNNTQVKCIKELDLSDTLGNDYALGYRCPFAIYSFEMITRAVELSIHNLISTPFDGSKIFEEEKVLVQWPILPDGTVYDGASDSIITDVNSNIIGMVYKRRKKYYRCRLTVQDQIIPKFVGQALAQEPEIVGQHSVDVFHCGKYYVASEEVLRGAVYSQERFMEMAKKYRKSRYPLIYKPATDSVSPALYKWPFRINGNGVNYQIRVRGHETFFAIIDDFSDVDHVMVKVGDRDEQLEICTRKTINRYEYESKLPNFMLGMRGKKRKHL